MGTKIKRFFKKIRIKRTTVLVLVFVFMSATLVRQLFELQIIQGQDYISKFESRTTKKRVIKSTRGNIYDRNGEELATNVLAYSVTLEDNGTYDSTREKNLTLNGVAYRVLKILQSNGDSINVSFHIVVDDNGNYAFDVDEGFTLNRFKADIYGEAMIDNLTTKQKFLLIGKECKIGFFNGAFLGILALVFLGLYIFLFKHYSIAFSFLISGCVGASLIGAMVVSSLVGTIVPMLFKKIGVDPAVASGPLITTINDLVAIMVYYGLVMLILIDMLHLG